MACPDFDSADFISVVSHQQRELLAAETLESDLDFAYSLQLEEALAASMASLPSTSSSSPRVLVPFDDDVVYGIGAWQKDALDRFEQEVTDRHQCEAEMRKMRKDVRRRAHDQRLAWEISQIPEDWAEFGDNFERPFGEGSSSREVFRIYFKELVREEMIGNSKELIMGSALRSVISGTIWFSNCRSRSWGALGVVTARRLRQ